MRFGRRHSEKTEICWKRDALDAFKRWLDALPDNEPPPDAPPADAEPSVGLVDLADAVSTLARESKALARSSDQSMRQLEGFLESARSQPPPDDSRTELAAIEARMRAQSRELGRKERNDVLRDLGDAYESLHAARERLAKIDDTHAPSTAGLFRRKSPPAANPASAPVLDIPLRKLKDVLNRNHVEDVARVGEPFDAKTMRVAAASHHGLVSPGCVSEIVRQGYRIQGDLVQTAEVTVEKDIDT